MQNVLLHSKQYGCYDMVVQISDKQKHTIILLFFCKLTGLCLGTICWQSDWQPNIPKYNNNALTMQKHGLLRILP